MGFGDERRLQDRGVNFKISPAGKETADRLENYGPFN